MKKSAFTLIELLVVIVIIGILATIGIASFNDYKIRANNTKIIMQAVQYMKIFDLYYVENEHYPNVWGQGVNQTVCLGDYGSSDTCNVDLVSGAASRNGSDNLRADLLEYGSYLADYPSVIRGTNGQEIDTYMYSCMTADCIRYSIAFVIEGGHKSCGGLKGLNETQGTEPDYLQVESTGDINSAGNLGGHTYCLFVIERGAPSDFTWN